MICLGAHFTNDGPMQKQNTGNCLKIDNDECLFMFVQKLLLFYFNYLKQPQKAVRSEGPDCTESASETATPRL